MDSITVLRCADPGARAGKHIGADGASAKIETKTNFTFRTIPVRDFDSLVGALAEVERDPLEYLIRGEPTPLAWEAKAAGRTVRRLTATDPIYFASAPRGRHWWLADSDDMLPPEGVDPTSLEAIEHAVSPPGRRVPGLLLLVAAHQLGRHGEGGRQDQAAAGLLARGAGHRRGRRRSTPTR